MLFVFVDAFASCFGIIRFPSFFFLFLYLSHSLLSPLILSYVSVTHILYVYRQLLLQNRVIVRLAAVNSECVWLLRVGEKQQS